MKHGLENRRIVNTRAEHQAAVLDDLLHARGAVTLEYPCLEIVPVDDASAFDAALRDLIAGRYHWLTLTSANTVFALARRLESAGLKLTGASFRSAAIGPATREAARRWLGLESMVVSEEFVAESMADAIPIRSGERVLLPESTIARTTLADMLRARGADVTVVPVYRTECGHGGEDVPGLLAQGKIDALTFTSTSTVTNFLERLAREGGRLDDLRGVCAACIGPVTADAARRGGFVNVLMPSEYTLTALAAAMDNYFCNQPSRQEGGS